MAGEGVRRDGWWGFGEVDLGSVVIIKKYLSWCTLVVTCVVYTTKNIKCGLNIDLGHIIFHGMTCPPITADGRRSCKRKPRRQSIRATHFTLQTLH